jgi:hypothetical protein
MTNERRFKRFKLEVVALDGKMLLTSNVKVLNLSAGGASVKSGEELPVGKELLITLDEKGKKTDIKGIVVQSAFCGTGKGTGGENAAFYNANIRFQAGQAEKISYVLGSREQHREDNAPVTDDRRRHVRFHMTIPLESVLSHTARFRVKQMSMSGMLIQSEQPLGINCVIPMNLSVAGGRVNFIGRVASCRMTDTNGKTWHDIGVEFLELTNEGRSLLKRFIDSLSVLKDNSAGEPAGK